MSVLVLVAVGVGAAIVLATLYTIVILPLFTTNRHTSSTFVHHKRGISSLLLSRLRRIIPRQGRPKLVFGEQSGDPSTRRFVTTRGTFGTNGCHGSAGLCSILIHSCPFTPRTVHTRLNLTHSLRGHRGCRETFRRCYCLLHFCPRGTPIRTILSGVITVTRASCTSRGSSVTMGRLRMVASLTPK